MAKHVWIVFDFYQRKSNYLVVKISLNMQNFENILNIYYSNLSLLFTIVDKE